MKIDKKLELKKIDDTYHNRCVSISADEECFGKVLLESHNNAATIHSMERILLEMKIILEEIKEIRNEIIKE